MVKSSIFGDLFYSGPDREILVTPRLGRHQETTRQGVHIIGELSGTPLLKNSLNAGADVVSQLAPGLRDRTLPDGTSHMVIVGAGAAGLAAALEAQAQGLSYVLIDQGGMATTVQKFHKRKPIFAEPAAEENRSRLWFEECEKEELLERWSKQIREAGIRIHAPLVMQDIRTENEYQVVVTDGGDFRALRLLIAIGKSGNPRRLGIPGEDLPHVHTSLNDPESFEGKRIAVVGAGDVGVEMALALCEKNDVTLLVRRNRIDRPKKRNRDAIHKAISEDAIKVLYHTAPEEVSDGSILINTGGEQRNYDADEVFLALGADLPVGLLSRLGIRLTSEWDAGRTCRFLAFLVAVALLYLWKGEFLKGFLFPKDWGLWSGDALGVYSWARTISDYAGGVIPLSTGMWFGALYSGLVVGYGIRCLYKYRKDPFQVKRYRTIIFSQVVLLWLVPEVLFQGLLATFAGVQESWRAYGLVIPAPLYVWNFSSPASANAFWLFYFALFSFVGVPLYSKYTGKMYCSWVCGCGCLAETFGDQWRHLAPRGRRWRAWELLGEWAVLGLVCILVLTGLSGLGAWSEGAWTVQRVFVDFFLAGVVGVVSYPFFGNRIWCRFLCPLSRVMHAVAATASKRKIGCGSHCIECGLCSKYCQMGIPVMEYARNAEDFDNKETSCIQCGICVTVCPVRNLQNGEWDEDAWRETVSEGALTHAK